MNNLVPFEDVNKMAAAVAKSGLFGMKEPAQALGLMLICQAEGLHPAIAARDYHIIQGKAALRADAMLARFQQAGGSVQWKEYTDTKVSGVFSHPQGGSLEIAWDIDRAKQAGVYGKDNWKKYPRAMLRARVISEGIRTVYPGCVVGVYTPEEVQDFDEPRKTAVPVQHEIVEPVEPDDFYDVKMMLNDKWSPEMKEYLVSIRYLAENQGLDDISDDKLRSIGAYKERFIQGFNAFLDKKVVNNG